MNKLIAVFVKLVVAITTLCTLSLTLFRSIIESCNYGMFVKHIQKLKTCFLLLNINQTFQLKLVFQNLLNGIIIVIKNVKYSSS